MIIFFGTRSISLNPVETGQNCHACQQPSIFLVPYQSYFHVFWIPIFPLSRDYQLVCSNCGCVYNTCTANIPNEVREKVKTPKWAFSGLIVGAALLIIMIVSSFLLGSGDNNTQTSNIIGNNDDTEVIYDLNELKAGDILEAKIDNSYKLVKITKVTEDSIYFSLNKRKTNIRSQLQSLKNIYVKHFDEENIIGYTRSEVLNEKTDFEILGSEN